MDNVQCICPFDQSNFRLAGHFDWSNSITLKTNKISTLLSCLLYSPLWIYQDFLIVEMQAETNWNCCLQIALRNILSVRVPFASKTPDVPLLSVGERLQIET